MTNWTRFFPTLLTAHRHLGAVCSGASSSTSEPCGDARTPALVMIAVSFLAWGVFAPSLPCDSRPGLAQDEPQPSDPASAHIATRSPSTPSPDDALTPPGPERSTVLPLGTDPPRLDLVPATDCSDDEPDAAFFL